MNKRALNHFFSKHAPQSEGSTKKTKYRLMHLFAVGILSVQMITSAVAPVYQVAAETTTQTSQTTEKTSTEQTKPTTASEPAASSAPAEAKTTSESSTEPAEETDPAKVRSDLLKAIAQFGDTAGTTVTVADNAIKIDLSAQLSKQVEAIKTAITPLVPDGYKAEITAKQAELHSIKSLSEFTEPDLASPIVVTWSQESGAATTTGTKVFPTSFTISLKSTTAGRTATWAVGDVITIPDLTYTGAYGTIALQPSFVKTVIPGIGTLEGNKITVTQADNGSEKTIELKNIFASNFTGSLPTVELTESTSVSTSFLGSSLDFTAIDASASWGDGKGEILTIQKGEDGGDALDLSFKLFPVNYGERRNDLFFGGGYTDAADFLNYVELVNDDTPGNYEDSTKETTMSKLADMKQNIFMVNTYPAGQEILTIAGSSLYARTNVGTITGITNDGKNAMIKGSGNSIVLVTITPKVFAPGTSLKDMKAALKVGETGYSKQTDGSFISLVNMGNYSEEGDHISYDDLTYPDYLWRGMMSNQELKAADGFNLTTYQETMVAADNLNTPPLFSAQFMSTVKVVDPSNAKNIYKVISTIEGPDGVVSGIDPKPSELQMDPIGVNTEASAAIQINYKSGDTTVGAVKKIYADPGTSWSDYVTNNPNEELFPKQFTVEPITYKLKSTPDGVDFGEKGSTTEITVEYEAQATIKFNYVSNGTEIATSKLIYAGENTLLTDYLTANATSETNSEAKLFPEEIKVGTTPYRLSETFKPADYNFGVGGSLTSVDVEYEKTTDIGFWTAQADSNLTNNTGTYGDAGLDLYVYRKNPWVDRIVGDPTADENKTEVLAKGIFGNDVNVGVKWYIDTESVLHLGSGTTNWVHTETGYFNNPDSVLPPDYPDDYRAGSVSPWYQYKDLFTKISVDGNVVLNKGSQYLFSTLDQVDSFTGLEKFDFSNVENTNGMFQSTYALKEMTGTADWNLSKVIYARTMFSNTSVASLDATNWGMNSVVDPYAMFYRARGLTEIKGTETWSMEKATTLQEMFFSAIKLQTLDLSGWDTINVKNMSNMFRGAAALTSIDTTGLTSAGKTSWDTSNVTTMRSMFNGAAALETIDTSESGWNTSSVTDMGYMFSDAGALKSLNTSNWTTSNVTNISTMFQNAGSLTELDTSKWNTSNVTNMEWMFKGAKSLEKLDFSAADTSKVTTMQNMLSGTTALREITFSKDFATAQLTEKTNIGTVNEVTTTTSKLNLPNTTTTLKWRNVADGTTTAPMGTEFLSAYKSAVPDTYVLIDTTQINPDFPDTGSDQRLTTLISASLMILLGVLGVAWFQRKERVR
ncbi:BspA family leucine-rich repeat surface protein [Enterococcus pingfangensis]|uniref:BspA family leucine-rich repeat surface protein n=1 Tax=Enterococcus pingfangensis TaxID=2559924 RepID=UPI0010F70B2A|nr:BspA family leucine-rich repeat surface protein [Enterococcus pingfangensis]